MTSLLTRASGGRIRIRPRFVARMLTDVPDLTLEERRLVATDAIARAGEMAGVPDREIPGRLRPPSAARPAVRLLAASPVLLGLAFFFGVTRLGPGIATTSGMLLRVVAFVVMLILVVVGSGLIARTVWLPYAWAILRERGHDVCLSCGSIGIASGDERTRCPECGATNPPSPRSEQRVSED